MPDDAGTWRDAARTDRGLRRVRNEDALLSLPASRIYAVADGMGGHAAGDVASRLAVSTLATSFRRPPSPRIRAPALTRRLIDAFDAANTAILEHAATNAECGGMGTTLTALAPLPGDARCVIAHIGDSRVYRLRDGDLTQLTTDHTWVQQQVEAGMLTPAAARHHPLSSVLSRVLGTPSVGPPDTLVAAARPGDRFLLCSDGLTTMLEDEDVHRVLHRDAPLDELTTDLIAAANAAGGLDNITVIVLEPPTGA